MLIAAAMLPYVTVALAKAGRGAGPAYDNQAPRAWTERLGGWRRRAEWAHRNHLEAFPPFAAAVILALLGDGSRGWIGALATAFVLLRVAYTAAYVLDRAALRSVLWFMALACVLALFGMAWSGAPR